MRDLFVIAAIALAVWFVYEVRGVFLPVFVALGLAYLFHPLITRAQERWRVPRVASITLVLILLGLGTAAFVAWLSPILVDQVRSLAKRAPQYVETLGGHYGIEMAGLSEQITDWTSRIQEDPEEALTSIFSGTGQALGVIGTVIGTTTYIAMTALLIPIYFFFFAWRFERISEVLPRLIPASRRDRTLEILGRMDEAVTGFFRGRLFIAVITGTLYALGWALTGVPYWFLLGAITGLLSIIPYVSLIGWPLAILLKYLDAASGSGGDTVDWVSIAVWPSVPYLIVQFLESWWLTPWIEGHTTNLSAITVIIVVLIGGAVGGFLGLLLAIPVAASVKILLQELVMPRWKAWAARH